ncbi:MAG: NAD(+) synthase, partial [Selenomonadaceae bacterium]|nr:NAD(+) synthase [Selenomonadaceae bacterium]
MAKIAYAQMNVEAGHPDINTKRILYLIERARAGGAQVVFFPELAISGKLLGDTFKQESFLRECEQYGEDIIAASRKLTVVFGNVKFKWELSDFQVFDSIFVARDGKVVDTFAKENLSAEERRYFSPPTAMKTSITVPTDGKDYKVLPLFDVDDISTSHFDFCVNFTAEPFSIDKDIEDKKISAEKPMIQVGAVGIQNTGKTVYAFDGASAVFNSRGKIVQLAEPFAETLNFVELDEIDKMPATYVPEEDEPAKIYRALSHGVREFLQNVDLSKVVIGASGGIDSAVAAALYVKVIGAENVLLVNMPSKFNSETTKNLSEQLAKNLGCKYCVVPIQDAVDLTVKQIESAGFEVSNFVRENIQAR